MAANFEPVAEALLAVVNAMDTVQYATRFKLGLEQMPEVPTCIVAMAGASVQSQHGLPSRWTGGLPGRVHLSLAPQHGGQSRERDQRVARGVPDRHDGSADAVGYVRARLDRWRGRGHSSDAGHPVDGVLGFRRSSRSSVGGIMAYVFSTGILEYDGDQVGTISTCRPRPVLVAHPAPGEHGGAARDGDRAREDVGVLQVLRVRPDVPGHDHERRHGAPRGRPRADLVLLRHRSRSALDQPCRTAPSRR